MMHGVEYQRDCVADYAVVTSQDDPSTIALEATNNAGESDIATGNETNEEAQLMNKASWLSCYTNLTSTIVGAGVLGMPYAFASAGWLSGTVLLTISAASSALAVHFLSVCTRKTKMPSSFYAVADVAFPPARFAIDAAVALKCFGVATSYLIVVGDLMPYAMEYWETPLFWQRRELWILLAFSFIAPLSYCESLDALKYTSGMSLLFILYLVFVVILFAIPSYDADGGTCGSEQHPCRGAIQANNLSVATLQILPVYIFGYTCQQNTFALVNELNHPVQRRIDSVIVASFGSSFLVYFVVAVCGYLTFGDNIKSDLLRTYPDTGLTTTARVLVSLIVACHYPLQAHPARKCVMTLLDGLSKSCSHATPTLRDEDLPASTVVTNPLSSHGLIELREHSSRHGSDVETRYKAEQSETKGFGLYLGLPEQSETTHISKSENQPSARRGGVCARLPPSLRISTYRMKMLSITTVFLAASFGLALAVTDLGVMLAVVGATGSTAISLILPGAFYTCLYRRQPQGSIHARADARADARGDEQEHRDVGRELGQLGGDETVGESAIGNDDGTNQGQGDGQGDGEHPEGGWKTYLAMAQCLVGLALLPLCLGLIIEKEEAG